MKLWKLLVSIVTFDFVFNESRVKRLEWYNSLTLPDYSGPYKYTYDKPIQIEALSQYLTFNETYLLLEKHGYVYRSEYIGKHGDQGYYVANMYKVNDLVRLLIANGKIKVPTGLECYRSGVDYNG